MTSHQRHICAIVIYNHWASGKYHRPRLRLSKRGSSPFASPSRRPLRQRRPTRRRGERGLSPTSFRQDDVKQRTTSHDRESPTEAITRTRVVRARSSATWDSTAIPAPDSFPPGAKLAERLSQADGAALTLSNHPHGPRHSTNAECADARIEEWDPRGDHPR